MPIQTLARLTRHATRRMQQRAISPAALDAVLRWGAPIEQNGATVVARDGAVLTTFR